MASCFACRVGTSAGRVMMRRKPPFPSEKLTSYSSKRFFTSPYVHIRPSRIDTCATALTNSLRTGAAVVSVSGCVYAAFNVENGGRSTALAEGQMDDHTFALMQEPGSVEEMQHVVAECFGSNCYGSERLWNLFQTAISDAMTDFSGGLKDHTERTIDEEKVNNKFPSLDLSLLNGNCGAIRSFEFNSEEPIPIENDWFSGLIQINLNPPSERDASVKTEHENRFEIQLQGRFKRKPSGTVYCGGELADKDFQCNVFMKGLTNVLLNFLMKYIGNDLAYSFGGKDKDGRDELPHIAFPLKTAMNDVIVTPAGEIPPPMGAPFVETNESRTLRKASTDTNDWSLVDTYSMSFTASSLDLPTWQVLYPYDTSLSLFWGDSPLRLVIYEKGEQRDGNAQLSQDANNYLFALQIKFLGIQQQNTDNAVEITTADENQSPATAVLG